MYTAFFYTKGNQELFETLRYYSNKYCIKLLEVKDLREMLLKGSSMDKYGLFVDTTTVDMSSDLVDYMLYQGGNTKLLGVLFIGAEGYDNKAIDDKKVLKVSLGEKFSSEFVAKADSLNYYLAHNKMSATDINNEVYNYLLENKLSTKYIGFSFIKDAIVYCLAEGGNVEKLTSSVYPYVSNKNSTTINSVERNMRIAIESCWKTSGNNMVDFSVKPSNKAFLSYCVGKLKGKLSDKM